MDGCNCHHVVFPVVCTPIGIAQGVWKIILHPDGLITDYSKVGGFGATFFNSGLIMSASIIIIKKSHATISGPTIACVFLMAGFSMFGKNIANIWPIILGVYLFSRHQKENFSKYVYIALYGTALSPLITVVALESGNLVQKLLAVNFVRNFDWLSPSPACDLLSEGSPRLQSVQRRFCCGSGWNADCIGYEVVWLRNNLQFNLDL